MTAVCELAPCPCRVLPLTAAIWPLAPGNAALPPWLVVPVVPPVVPVVPPVEATALGLLEHPASRASATPGEAAAPRVRRTTGRESLFMCGSPLKVLAVCMAVPDF